MTEPMPTSDTAFSDAPADSNDVTLSDVVGAARDVLNVMFFSDVLEDADAPPAPRPETMQVYVKFEGDGVGEFRMEIDDPTAESLAGSFLGAEPGSAPSPDEVQQVMGELGNMVCGAFLSRYEKDGLFSLSSPTIERAGAAMPSGVARSLQLLDGTMELRINWSVPVNRPGLPG
ncbi:MAG: chemotaxis protein CheX [Acidobacteria bacterium]|nr:chemotaxis protein CheX [Acidobacteriota bacterium]